MKSHKFKCYNGYSYYGYLIGTDSQHLLCKNKATHFVFESGINLYSLCNSCLKEYEPHFQGKVVFLSPKEFEIALLMES